MELCSRLPPVSLALVYVHTWTRVFVRARRSDQANSLAAALRTFEQMDQIVMHCAMVRAQPIAQLQHVELLMVVATRVRAMRRRAILAIDELLNGEAGH